MDLRFSILDETMKEMFQYLRDGGQVGILDGSNLSHSTREHIMKEISKEVVIFSHVNV